MKKRRKRIMEREKLYEELAEHEGYRDTAYLDTEGYITIGKGLNISSVPFSEDLLEIEFRRRVENHIEATKMVFDDYDQFPENRQRALCNLMFNIGLKSFLGFKKMIEAVKAGDWERAADEMIDSRWAVQVGQARSEDLEMMLRRG